MQGKKKSDCENEGDLDGTVCDDNDFEDKRKGLGCGRRRKKPGDALFSSDDFLEIDSITGLLGISGYTNFHNIHFICSCNNKQFLFSMCYNFREKYE